MGACCSQESATGEVRPRVQPPGDSYASFRRDPYSPRVPTQTMPMQTMPMQTMPMQTMPGPHLEELPYVVDDNRYKVVIAIDFGTTFSGCSWGLTGTTDMVKDIEKWPNQVGNYPKIPTAVVYDPQGNLHAWGQTAENLDKFGRMPTGYMYYSKFKLYLDEKVMRSSLPPLPPGKTAVHVIADYLREMHKYVLTKTPNSISREQTRYCLTIPASWSPDAKRAMRDAAILGELIGPQDPTERLLLIAEPEAAMIYVKEKQPGIDGCRNVMICDAGGGTVDMCTFAIGKTPHGQQTLHEISLGHGKSCGSIFIDMAMENYLRNAKLGPQVCARLHARSVPAMMNSFIDTVKRNFKPETDEYRIPSPVHNDRALLDMLPPTTLIDGIDLILTFEELRQHVFDPVIRDILHLIRDQIRQLPAPVNQHQSSYVCDKLVLVGGFGESEYLLSRVQEEFMKNNLVRDVETVIHAGLAVVKGAAYFGLRPASVTQRVSRLSYGICVLRNFEPGVDPESKKIPGGDGIPRCNDSFFKYVTKGEAIQLSRNVTHYFKTYHKDKLLDVRLYAFDGKDVPRYIDSPGVFFVGTVSIATMPPIMRVVDANNPLPVQIHMYFGLTEIIAKVEIENVQYTANFSFKNSMLLGH